MEASGEGLASRELTDGATAIVRGAIESRCTFFAGYPITPASPILMQMMRELPRVGGVAVQGEDEIASIGMCIGAVLSGARALTATSGPGLSLYSENIGLAIMGEVPLVIVDVQRLGPATGGATTVGQGDVQFARWGTAGGYPLIVLAPSSVTECYTLTRRAFDLSERFRCPVIVLADKELAMTTATVDPREYGRPDVRDRDPLTSPDPPYRFVPADEVFPVAQLGGERTVRFTGSTHDERAMITKSPVTVGRLNEHLRAKIEDHADEICCVADDEQDGARTLLVAYGITAGAMREAVMRLRARGVRVAAITVGSLWPVPEGLLRRAMAGKSRIVVAELNHGQYRREIERLAAGAEVVGIHRVDGELIAPEAFEEAVS